ncbi:MAG: T9SS-dependent M36 family metallopeptidase [Saprospiraceae bacterium]
MIKTHLLLRIALIALLLAGFLPASAQQFQAEINAYLKQEKKQLTDTDIANYVVSDQYTNRETGVTYTYLHQQVGDLRIFNAVSTMALRDGEVVHFANRFHANAAGKVNATQPVLGEQQAIEAAAAHLGLTLKETTRLLSTETQRHRSTFSRGGIAREDMTVELLYLVQETALRLAWNVSLAPAGSADWWNIRIDALTGEYLEKNNWTTHCDFGPGHQHGKACGDAVHRSEAAPVGEEKLNIGNYNVYALPLEAPLFGDRSLLTDPHSTVASPYGWHDDNGEAGAEYTITRGNNVFVYEDRADENNPGYSPDGGPELNFDFPIDLALAPEANEDAILTNLFYMNNMLHDILYVHGFDERAGNFQATNYNNEGLGGDYVEAEGQDGGGTNNANFSTPEDGFSGRMQMYLWPADVPAVMEVLSPETIAGTYFAVEAAFGPDLSSPVTGTAVLVEDDTAPATDACEAILNVEAIAGKIVVIDRGTCSFISKINAVEQLGAIAVIVVNNIGGDPISMGGAGTTDIPSVMISQADGELVKAQLLAGQSVEITLGGAGGASGADRDGSLDNGIVAHEYGHGLSTRLTGGPTNSNCLFNGEQGGEGWSDWLGLILTIEPGDAGPDTRGIGTYALDDESGQGIRRFPYSTDMSINPHTYGSLANSVGVHAVGEIWSQVLWDMTWKLIDAEGFDPDWYNGTGGNNTALRLVIEGMKLQPCGPGYLDARDAILKADEMLYQNAHRCLIWEAFAKRGMGADAIQGSANEVGDETEDFTIPNICLTATIAPTANFAVNNLVNCTGRFSFTDLSTDIPQFYLWDFGDGNTSEEENPVHIYAVPGTYTVTLTVTNNIGTDETSFEVAYATLPAPALSGNTTVCEGGSTTLTAAVETGNTAIWSVGGTVVYTGTAFPTPEITEPVTYSVQQLEDKPILNAGPEDNTLGGGGNHNTGFDGHVLFEAFAPLKIVSVFIYAQGAGNRTIRLLDGAGEELQSVTVFAPAGPSRVALNFEIPAAGNYRLANTSENLYRNNAGADYPYDLDGLLSIYSSNATGGNEFTFYYYFYDWEVQEATCLSETAEVTLSVAPGPLAAFTTASDNLNVNFTDNSSGVPNSWSWNFGDGTAASTDQNPTHSYTEAGIYLVELTVSNGTCSSTSRQEVTVGITGTNDPDEAYGLKVYPNPAGDAVNIELLQAISSQTGLEIRDAAGRLVLSQILRDQRTSVNTSSFAAGVYQFRVIGASGASVRMVTIVR